MPKDVAEYRRIDKDKVNTLQWESIFKEMKEVHIDIQEYDDEVVKIKGFQEINCNMIFDVNMGDNFRRKAHLVAGVHTNEAI